MEWTPDRLRAFEDEIRQTYEAGKIRSPVHLSGGNEKQLIEIFKNVRPEDWVYSTHRSHYHALLKGVPPEYVKKEILENRSIHLNHAASNFYTSAIVGGCLPIALGTAFGIKLKGLDSHVWTFVGDMASEMGCFHEATKYAQRNELPITFVVEDNGLSVNTPTQECWGNGEGKSGIIRYNYERVYPHHGSGKWVTF